jgi:hypothetical protein
MNIYYVEAAYGCGIRVYETDTEAEQESLLDMGRDNFVSVRFATVEDIQHVQQMGGWIPTDAVRVLEVHEQMSTSGSNDDGAGEAP